MRQQVSRAPYRHPLSDGRPPAWAAEWGEDLRGVFVGFSVGDVSQRLRWIPPGRFMMGSPESETGRLDDEDQYEVTLSKGYWLGDVPVTQVLWQAVMGDNPSRFKGGDLPVENVSWEGCQRFVERLNSSVPGLEVRLPTEAEWEYACRAGTGTATWLGDLEILGENNAPLLDRIAWYGGNCGVDFELDNGADTTGWPEKQHDFTHGGTHPVGRKEPNPWGLYDMLGNVYEWCTDWYGPYSAEPAVDPRGPEVGSYRVMRGGGWSSAASHVRAASRSWLDPADRSSLLGFRLVG